MEIVFSIGSAILVVVLTQCWQQYRHNDLRKDRADERKEERVEESQRRQREAIHAFLNAIQEIVNRHRTEWSNIVSQVDDEQRRKNRGWAENVNLREGIKIEIDKLSLLVTDLEVRACIADMRKAAGRIRVEPEEENWSIYRC